MTAPTRAPQQRSPESGPGGRALGDLSSRTVLVPAHPEAAGVLVSGDDVRWTPFRPPRTTGPVLASLAIAGATAVGWRWAGRPPAVRTITMGPGGWVSFKGLKPAHVDAPRPWWTRLLRAERTT